MGSPYIEAKYLPRFNFEKDDDIDLGYFPVTGMQTPMIGSPILEVRNSPKSKLSKLRRPVSGNRGNTDLNVRVSGSLVVSDYFVPWCGMYIITQYVLICDQYDSLESHVNVPLGGICSNFKEFFVSLYNMYDGEPFAITVYLYIRSSAYRWKMIFV